MKRLAFLAGCGAATLFPVPGRSMETLRVIALGDSVAWGQGLLEDQKIERLLARRWSSRFNVLTANYAHSGGTIGFDAAGPENVQPREIPQAAPPLRAQVQRAASERFGAPWDLAIICASINDVNVKAIFDPTMSPSRIRELVDHYCHRDLASALTEARSTLLPSNPALVVAVLGYYSVVSERSERIPTYESIVRAFLGLGPRRGPPAYLDPHDPVARRLIENSLAFAARSKDAMIAAVDDANRSGPAIFHFIDPDFGEEHASMTPVPYVWGMDRDANPTDDLTPFRRDVCRWGLGRSGADYFVCERASVGHPNPAGAARYADRIDAIVGPLVFDLSRRRAIAARSAFAVPAPARRAGRELS
jgi:lysophospholipase L1-like esterase